jgi:hypothetical protein
MDFREIAPGLARWTARHPDWRGATDWPEPVGCVYYEAADAVVVIDPLVPRGEEVEFWELLDRRIEDASLPVAVLLTAPWHQRSTPVMVDRYGATVWIHESFAAQSGPVPTGVGVFVPGGDSEGQVAFLLHDHRALVVAEFFMGTGNGLRLCPSPALSDPKAFSDSLRRLLDFPIDHVLVSHGEPVLHDGRRRITEALGGHG